METIEDIVREMRALAKEVQGNSISNAYELLMGCADRIEKAMGVEREATREKSSQVGNAAKMREALTKVKEWMERRIATRGFETSATFPTMLEDVVLPALSAPPRNCDLPAVIADPHMAWILDDDNWNDYGSPELEIHKWLLAEAKGETK